MRTSATSSSGTWHRARSRNSLDLRLAGLDLVGLGWVGWFGLDWFRLIWLDLDWFGLVGLCQHMRTCSKGRPY